MKRIYFFVMILILLVIPLDAFVESNVYSTGESDTLHVYFWNVGHGDCTIILYKDQCVIVDCGGKDGSGNEIVSFLNQHSISFVDYIIISHPDADHINGFYTVFDSGIGFGTIYSSVDENNSNMKGIKNRIGDFNITVPPSGFSFCCGDVNFTIFRSTKLKSANSKSLVVKIDYLGRSILIMGDAEKDTENEFLSCEYNLEADVVRIGHHGSASSSSVSFLNAVNAEYAIVSGEKDDFKAATLQNIVLSHCAIWQTWVDHTIECTIDVSGLSITNYSPSSDGVLFIYNTETHVLHSPDCPNRPTKNAFFIYDRSQLTENMKPHDTKNCLHGCKIGDLMSN